VIEVPIRMEPGDALAHLPSHLGEIPAYENLPVWLQGHREHFPGCPGLEGSVPGSGLRRAG
jgi:hypothetical protein